MPLPVLDVIRYWSAAANGARELPWREPPAISVKGVGIYPISALFVTTVSDTAYFLNGFTEFYRLMVRDGHLKYVHTNGREEIVLFVHGSLNFSGSDTVRARNDDNIVPFKRP